MGGVMPKAGHSRRAIVVPVAVTIESAAPLDYGDAIRAECRALMNELHRLYQFTATEHAARHATLVKQLEIKAKANGSQRPRRRVRSDDTRGNPMFALRALYAARFSRQEIPEWVLKALTEMSLRLMRGVQDGIFSAGDDWNTQIA